MGWQPLRLRGCELGYVFDRDGTPDRVSITCAYGLSEDGLRSIERRVQAAVELKHGADWTVRFDSATDGEDKDEVVAIVSRDVGA